MNKLEEMIKQLPPDLQQEVEDFVSFLLEKKVRKPKGRFKFDWEGALKEEGEKHTSVELQHKALEWRGD